MKKYFLFMFIILFSIALVSAVPPTETFVGTTQGLQIEFPQFDYLRYNQTRTFYFHVYNISNGISVIENTECWFHLYNSSGDHIVEANTSTIDHKFDYEFEINGTNFTGLGNYVYVVYCNNSDGLGGFAAKSFDVTPSGKEVDTSLVTGTASRINYLFIIMAILFFAGFIFYQGSTPIKLSMILTSLIFLLIAVNIQFAVLNNLGDVYILNDFMDSFTSISWILMWFIGGFIILLWIFTFLNTWLFKRNLRNASKFNDFEDF